MGALSSGRKLNDKPTDARGRMMRYKMGERKRPMQETIKKKVVG